MAVFKASDPISKVPSLEIRLFSMNCNQWQGIDGIHLCDDKSRRELFSKEWHRNNLVSGPPQEARPPRPDPYILGNRTWWRQWWHARDVATTVATTHCGGLGCQKYTVAVLSVRIVSNSYLNLTDRELIIYGLSTKCT